jgi:catalase
MPVAKSFHYLFPTVVAFALSSAAWAQSAAPAPTAEKPPLAEQLVDSLNGVFGKHPGARAVHARASSRPANSSRAATPNP